MIPIHELLARVRHDPDFGQGVFSHGVFELGYLDRFDTRVQCVVLGIVDFPEGEKRVFEFVDTTGQKRRIPFHRIREVYRDGALIWHRPVTPSQ
jgi:uncharacterized protein (UPF0248 family)